MVRAGVVNHPEKWKESGFTEIEKPPKRYAIIDLQSLSELNGFADLKIFKENTASGLSKGWRTAWRSATIAGLKRLRLEAWRLLRGSRMSLASKPHIADSSKQMEVTRCANRRKLTDSIWPLNPSWMTRKE